MQYSNRKENTYRGYAEENEKGIKVCHHKKKKTQRTTAKEEGVSK